MKRGLCEILDMASEAKTIADKTAVLRANADNHMGALLRCLFDDNVQWAVLPVKPDYRPCPYLDQEGNLRRELGFIHKFFKGGTLDQYQPGHPKYARQEKIRVQRWIEMLETLMPRDAELIIAVQQKKLPRFRGLMNRKILIDAFPELVSMFGASTKSKEEAAAA